MSAVAPESPTPPPIGAAVRTLGSSIHVRQDRTTAWLAMLCGALVVVLGLVVSFGHFARTESVRGYASAVSGISRLDAQLAGVVKQIHVPQGGMVAAGQPIMTLQIREVTSKGVSTVGATAASLRQKRTNLAADQARIRAFLDASKGDNAQLTETIGNVIKATAQNEADIQRALTRQEEMVRKVRQYMNAGYATRDTLNTYERTAFDYARQLSEIRVRRAELTQQSTDRVRTLQQLVMEKQAQLSVIATELGIIDAQLANVQAQTEIEIIAPFAGQVASLLAEVGTAVVAEQVVAIVGDPKAEPLIVLEVPSRAIGLAKVGQRVVLKYDAFPFKTFGVAHGTITAIATSPIKSPSVTGEEGMTDSRPAVAAATAAQSVYRVEVKPESRTIHAYGRDETIALGSTLSADIVIERRRLIDWVLDPIRAMRGRG
jgi:membrane fusion protein